MRRGAQLLSKLMLLLALAVPVQAASLLLNPGFEIGRSGANAGLPGWQTYGPNVFGQTNAALAHGGANFLKVYQTFSGALNYSGVFQDYISGPGTAYSADGWAYTAGNDALAGQNVAWLEVTFRDATANVLALYRSALITTNALALGAFPKSQWVDLRLTNQCDPLSYQVTNTTSRLLAPDGTRFLRYQVVFAGDANNSAGSVYFDDLNLTQTAGAPYGNLNIVWSDEFNGTAINRQVWTYDTGNSGWGNSELENYTSRTNNAYEAGGLLHLVARAESYGGSSYTSARMKSQGLFSWKYGRLEWRAQLPSGTGFWPALWLLGTNITTLGWPACGEIDVLENNGSNPLMVQGSLHSGSDETAIATLIGGASVTNFNTYTLDWTTNALLFYVDGHLYESQTSWSSVSGNPYPFPFDQPFFLIMNLAIGGSYLGYPSTNAINAGSHFPAEMQVDYVRIFSPTEPLSLNIRFTNANWQLAWPTNIVCHLEAQTNSLAAGLRGGWSPVASSANPFGLRPVATNVFYRLVSP